MANRILTSILILPFLASCTTSTGNVSDRNRAAVEAYQQAHFKPRIDQVLATSLDTAVARREELQSANRYTIGRTVVVPYTWRQARAQLNPSKLERMEARPNGIPNPSLGTLHIGDPIQIEGHVRASRSGRLNKVREVVVSNGKEEFEVVDPVVRKQLAAALGKEVWIKGRVAGVRGSAVAIDPTHIRYLD